MSETCQHYSCEDSTDNTVLMENGDEFYLCEDHQHMNPDGSPVDGYEPNDPSKFSYNVAEEILEENQTADEL